MRVLYVLPELPADGPNARHTRAARLLPILDGSIDLGVFAFTVPGGALPEVRRLWSTSSATSAGRLVRATFSPLPRVFARYSSPESVRAFRDAHEAFRPDIVHFDSFGPLALLPVAQELGDGSRPRTVAHTHDSVTRADGRRAASLPLSAHKLDLWLQTLKIERVERTLYPTASLCLVDSQEDAEFLRELNPSTSVRVLPLGFDDDVFNPEGDEAPLTQPAIVFSGSMRSEQSVDGALYLVRDIMPTVWDRIPETTLYLVGAGSDERLSRLAREFPDRVVVTGFVDDLASYLRSATVYACPLRLGSGMRTRVVEAAAARCPIVSTPVGVRGIAPEAEEPPWRIATDARSFAAELLRLLEEPEARERLGAEARRTVLSRYSWEQVGATLVQTYEDLVAARGRMP